ncbi:adenylate/guanylate cyclase domain-containing protein [Fimbriiglobus ruber]|nr:adenylate/guanylate cyclase domain-containing protein [Fimbriiglobus ruber]
MDNITRFAGKVAASKLFKDIDDIPGLLRSLNAGEVVLPLGKQLVTPGTKPSKVFWIIAEGSVAIWLDGYEVATRAAPDLLGESEFFFPGHVAVCGIVAIEATTCITFRHAELLASHHRVQLLRNLGAVAVDKLIRADATLVRWGKKISQLQQSIDKSQNAWYRERSTEAYENGLRTVTAVTPRTDRFVIWFSDLIGYSIVVRGLDPEKVQNLVCRALNDQQDAINENEGHIDKFLGDGVMAFWPIANSQEDRCRQSHLALKAALESVVRLAHPGPDGASKLRIRLGLHCGEALFVNLGSRDRMQVTLIGQDVNKAARLEQYKDEDADDASILASIRVSSELADCLTAELLEAFSEERMMTAKYNEQISFRICLVRTIEQAKALTGEIDAQLARMSFKYIYDL